MPPILLGIKKAERGWRIRVLPELFRKNKDEVKEEEDGLFNFTVGRKAQPGETEYRIGLIPFGGFVKMLGQEDVGPVKESKDPRSYANKPALVRAAVLAAGVTFNVISAVIVYIVVFLVGVGLPAPIVGEVLPGSSAQQAGIWPGDEIIEISGEDGRLDFSDVVMAGVLSGKDAIVPMKIRREDGTIEEVKLTAAQIPGVKFRGFGIERASTLTIANLIPEDAEFLERTTGLLPGDRIKAVGGIDVNTHWQFEEIVESTFEPNVVLLAERQQQSGQKELVEGKLELVFLPTRRLRSQAEADLTNICGIVPRMSVEGVEERAGIKERLLKFLGLSQATEKLEQGDIIVGLNDVNYPTYDEMRTLTKEYMGKSLDATVLRGEPNGAQRHLTVTVALREDQEDPNNVVIGIAPLLEVEHPVVARTIAASQKQAPSIPRGATITAVDGVEVSNFYDIARELKKNAGERVTVDWRIDEQTAGDAFVDVPEDKKVADVVATPKQIVPFKQLERLYKAKGPFDAVWMGYKRTKIFIIQTYITLQRLIGGLVSPKELMGPVGILAFSYRIVADQPFIYYVYFLGLISASIAVLNFLPLPPLDGGLTLLLLVEKIKGSALSVRAQEVIAYVGWGLVGALLLYVTFNDIARLIFG
jgi:regulator of sigma E protease